MLSELILKNRSYRRFDGTFTLTREVLVELVNLARLSPSAANRQPLRFLPVHGKSRCADVYTTLSWAGYLTGWNGPEPHERPTGYLVVCGDTEVSPNPEIDAGIAVQSICLGAVERGLGCCIFGAVNRDRLRELFRIDPQYRILLVVAVGKPVEKVEVEPVGKSGDIRYWRDDEQVHHVPKRSLEEVLIG